MKELRRRAFAEVADLYDRYRPLYPESLFDAIFDGFDNTSDVLEIGCGTGQATVPLVERAHRVTAIDIDQRPIDIVRQKVGDKANLVVSDFESSTFTLESFDLVVSATAIHWLNAEIAFPKMASLLRAGGRLASWSFVIHRSPGDKDFFLENHEVYDRHKFHHDKKFVLPDPGKYSHELELFRAQSSFENIREQRFASVTRYTTEEYLGLLQTYSGVLILTEDSRRSFLQDMGQFIDERFDGVVERHGEFVLTTATPIKA